MPRNTARRCANVSQVRVLPHNYAIALTAVQQNKRGQRRDLRLGECNRTVQSYVRGFFVASWCRWEFFNLESGYLMVNSPL